MKLTRLILASLGLFTLPAMAQQAQPLDVDAARAALSTKPPRNPVKSTSPIVKRTYERRAGKGLAVETGTPATVEVEVVHRADGTTEEHPFVCLPILFVVSTDTLLDATSRANADQMAGILSDLIQKENARFTLQGHTSAEGDAGANQTLSEQRAARILALLTAKGVPSTALTPLGLGETCAQAAETAPEPQRQLDRRVLIVRMK
jgi:outer membrane protein OmpA-like peptidoglycan-associated protein